MLYKNSVFIKSVANVNKHLEPIMQKFNFKFAEILFVSDEKIWNLNKNFFPQNFLNKFGEVLLLEKPIADMNFVEKISEKSKNFKLILAFGSGTISDLCKYASFKNNLDYAIIISALSMNGYVAKNASITLNDHKKTLNAHLPKILLADMRILKHSPIELTKAGIADVLCFLACKFDITINDMIFGIKINKESINIQENIVKNFIKNYEAFDLKDNKFLKILLMMIINSGYAMTLNNSSQPASQTEHLIAHYLAMKKPEIVNEILHGKLIAITVIPALKAHMAIIKLMEINQLKNNILKLANEEFPSKKLKDKFSDKIIHECYEEFINKITFIKNNQELLINFEKNNKKIFKKLYKIHQDSLVIYGIFNHFKIAFDNNEINISESEIQEATYYAKYIRNRITALDLLYFS